MKLFNPLRILTFALVILTCVFFHDVNADESTSRSEVDEPITSTRCNQFTFDATGSYDINNSNVNFFWDFGDGQTASEPVVSHKYQKPGDYTVSLTIKDNSGQQCSSATTTQKVRVNISPDLNFTAPETACINEPVAVDGSASRSSRGKLKLSWDFGDGTASVEGKEKVIHTYAKGGSYSIKLTGDDNSQQICSNTSYEKPIYINEPPAAEAGDDVLQKCINSENDYLVQFDASKTTALDQNALTYSWDFGDGYTAKGMKASHRYTSPGTYDVKLVVKDSSRTTCASGVDFMTVRLNEPPKAEAGEDIIACPGEAVVFDGNNSYTTKKGTLAGEWYFGDGESGQGLKTTHAYSKPGKYQASLSVTSELNTACGPSRDTRQVSINSAPMVSIKSIDATCLGNKVEFDASTAIDPDGDNLEYYWTFGDGQVLRAGSKVTHDYRQGGNYRVSVIVDDGKGSSCSTATASANIKINTAPVADAGPNLSCCTNKEVKFDARASHDSDGDTLTYNWFLGDGTKKSGDVVNHTYTKNGDYNVTLTVDDGSGTTCSSASSGFVAKVKTKPVPVIGVR